MKEADAKAKIESQGYKIKKLLMASATKFTARIRKVRKSKSTTMRRHLTSKSKSRNSSKITAR
jgi:hypothetical protein